ncbi:hypothetical protein F2Q68_00029153 [Brassica cretica]|uniref:Uncharacterized protein n=1 Tax=Brassica cretica TaxID=69181 RepID=A0A8S9GH48_BRACR|nr:hypothetical protein F2Q68_00029153 [Brassica cretica]
MADVDRYAPEYLVGLHPKVASSRSSLGMSSDSSLSAEAEETSLDSFEDILEASELVEIAGTSKMEVENAKLKAELASAISRICSLGPQVEYDVLEDGSEVENLLKNAAEKTAEALQAKDEYEKHLLSMLKEKQRHCDSYEKRIRELEQRLNDEYLQGKRYVNSKDVSGLNLMEEKGNKAHVSGSEPMDEVSCVSNLSSKQPCKAREGMDENMVDSSQVLSHHPLDSSMLESQQNNEKGGKDNVFLSDSSTAESPTKSLGNNVVTNIGLDTKHSDDFILELKSELMEKSDKLSETESKLNGAMEEVASLSRELEMNQKILEESQVLQLFHNFYLFISAIFPTLVRLGACPRRQFFSIEGVKDQV